MTPDDSGKTLRRFGHSLCASNPAMLELRIMDALRRRLPELMKTHGVPGVQCAVAIDDRAIREIAVGELDAERHVPLSTSTRFCFGSLSKPVSAVVLLSLAAQGQIDLDAPIGNLVGDFAETLHEGLSDRTCGQLLRHAAEVPHFDSVWYHAEDVGAEALRIDRTHASQFLETKVDLSRHSRIYSSRGYTVLQLVVERYLGKRFDEIARPTLERIAIDIRFDSAAGRAAGIARDHDSAGKVLPHMWTLATVSSGVVGTAGTLARVIQWALQRRGDCMRRMFERPAGCAIPHTCGLHVWKNVDERILDHGSARIGMRGVLKVIPDAGLVFVMLANGDNGVEISRKIVGLIEELGLARIRLWA